MANLTTEAVVQLARFGANLDLLASGAGYAKPYVFIGAPAQRAAMLAAAIAIARDKHWASLHVSCEEGELIEPIFRALDELADNNPQKRSPASPQQADLASALLQVAPPGKHYASGLVLVLPDAGQATGADISRLFGALNKAANEGGRTLSVITTDRAGIRRIVEAWPDFVMFNQSFWFKS